MMKEGTLKRHLKIVIKEEVDAYLKKKAKELEENKRGPMLEELIYIAANYNHGIEPARVDTGHTIEDVKEEFKKSLTEWGKKHKLYKKEIFDENFEAWNPRYKVYMHELLSLFEEINESAVRLNTPPTEDPHPALPSDPTKYDDKEHKKKEKGWEGQQKIPGEK